MLGTLVNTAAVIVGAGIGLYLIPGLPQALEDLVVQAVSLAVVIIGASMALEAEQFLLVLISVVLGAVTGWVLGIDRGVNAFGDRLEAMVSDEGGDVAKGFVLATLLYCVGPLAVVGSLEGALAGTHDTLFAKSVLDGTMSVILGAAFGPGVLFSAASVFLYQGSIVLLASWIEVWLSEAVVNAMTASGGLLVLAIGLNMLQATSIKVANLLPAIVWAAVLTAAVSSSGMMNLV